jgi:hypothetical protein
VAHGGKRQGAGRKSKAEEQKLIERLTPLDDVAFAALEEGLNNREFGYVKMFFEYRFGKPQDKVDITSGGEQITGIKIVDVDGTEV